jgi:hypothetical protein
MISTRFACSLLLAIPLVACSGSPDESVEQNPSASEALTMPACGTTLGTFDGTAAHSNGVDTSTGYSCAGWGTYGLQYQCVELVMRHFKTHWNLSWHGNAKDLLNNAPKADVDVFYNGDAAHPPVPGDMIVWPNGAYGHVALVTAVNSSSIDILEQNVKGSGKATLGYSNGKVAARWGNWVPQGWAHAKANGATSNTNTNTNTNTNNVNWDCANSAYAGNQYWTCNGGNLYECQNGVPQEQTCANGCNVNAVGTNDTCKTATVNWNCANSSYNGQQYWTCSGSARYICVNGVPQMESCANGCQSEPLGTNDQCK